ncbi:RNA transcription, translation and transport factor protein-like [Daphnia pulex]|uniref:RNA transcription, translation and transport factor protein-like n=1 Tax=Daphnia pulex TaxID=6669 RepID=UPI001EDE943B|nr:RNA transcription, translation and transport factor protein-like [Daphnia pulex]
MFKRKLQALGFPNPDTLNTADEKQFRSTIVWLEDQKVRRYKIEDRESLRNTTAEQWNQAFEQYLKDLDCPFANGSRPEIVDWLLGLAVQFEFNEKPESYTSSPKIQQQTSQQSNPLDNLDFESEDFKVGVVELANLLQVPRHPDHLMTLEGICNVIQEKLSQDALKEALKTKNPGNPVQFENISFGLDIKSPNVSSAANVLRYLFIHDLRDLQTKINECLVCVQALTANPKTDTKLGKVGF